MTIDVGSPAPDFTLPDPSFSQVTLSSFRERKNVLLVFFPFAFSGVCTGELCQLRDELPRYESADVQVLAVSTDPPFALRAWAEREGYRFPLLTDFWPHGAVAQLYGVFNEQMGMADRGTFVLDRAGVVRFAERGEPMAARDQSAWLKVIESL